MPPPFLLPCRSTVLLLVALSFTNAWILTFCATDSSDVAVLQALLKSISNPSALSSWIGDPCDDNWEYVICDGSRVTELQLKNAGLEGTLPSNLNQLSSLQQIALQGNSLNGPLPSFSGLASLTTAYLGDQQFTGIPLDFFKGLTSLVTFTLQNNPLNSSQGWSLPSDIASSTGLTTLVLTNTSLSGPIPDFLGTLTSLQELGLAYNTFTGGIPLSFSGLTQLSRLELNNNVPTLSGSISVVGSIPSVKTLWLQVNSFSGTIPSSLGASVSLQECRLNDNQLVGTIPSTFSASSLQIFSVKNNDLIGAIPVIQSITNSSSYIYYGNKFCQSEVGVECDLEVSALISFLAGVNYPSSLISEWDGNSSCTLQGVTCNSQGKVATVNLPSAKLSGTISPYLGNLTFLARLVLSGNNLTGTIPESLTKLSSLVLVDVENNNLYGPIPSFDPSRVTLVLSGNVNINTIAPPTTPIPIPSGTNSPSNDSSSKQSGVLPPAIGTSGGKSSTSHLGTIAGVVVGVLAIVVSALIGLAVFMKKRQKFGRVQSPDTAYLRASGSGDDGDVVKVTVNRISASSGVSDVLNTSNRNENLQVLEAGNLLISIQLLRSVTNNFSEENVLGRGGFGVVYKGELDDGTKIAVKRMLSSMVSNKGLDEFQAEIAVLTKVRHRHLVALLGYCIEGNERLLVYEYMPLGTLSQHLFEWRDLDLPPLSWDKRLSIALDVARGIEYLHGLAHRSFIHRDLKPSNILLGDDYRAKVSDFGLVKPAPDGGKFSVETRLAGTFGYLAPEYAVTGRVTTKADVFSFGVVLMELLTGRKALDESEPEDSMHLVTWFRRQTGNKGSLFSSVDSSLQVNDAISQSILIVSELAGHCAAREPYNRPDMGHAVNVLAPLVEQWKPTDVAEDDGGIDLHMTLPQALKKWQAFEGVSITSSDYLDDNAGSGSSMSSLPARPAGLAQTFSSTDGR